MTPKVSLLIFAKGKFELKCLDFDRPVRGLIGRDYDCLIEFPDTPEFSDISRHHCEVDIDPPRMRVRDVGSRNGTFVNAELIGQRDEALDPTDVNPEAFPYRELKDGDTLLLGMTLIRVKIADPQAAIYELQPDRGTSAGTVAQVGDTMNDLRARTSATTLPTPEQHQIVTSDQPG